MPDQPILPPYINALLFKDQIFEEDEREFLAKKKKEEMEEEEMAEMMRQELEDILPMLEERKEKETKEEKDESLDNPFMKPVRTPRTPMKRKHWDIFFNIGEI